MMACSDDARSSLRSQLHVTALHGPCPDAPDPRHRRQTLIPSCRTPLPDLLTSCAVHTGSPRAIATALGTDQLRQTLTGPSRGNQLAQDADRPLPRHTPPSRVTSSLWSPTSSQFHHRRGSVVVRTDLPQGERVDPDPHRNPLLQKKGSLVQTFGGHPVPKSDVRVPAPRSVVVESRHTSPSEPFMEQPVWPGKRFVRPVRGDTRRSVWRMWTQ